MKAACMDNDTNMVSNRHRDKSLDDMRMDNGMCVDSDMHVDNEMHTRNVMCMDSEINMCMGNDMHMENDYVHAHMQGQ